MGHQHDRHIVSGYQIICFLKINLLLTIFWEGERTQYVLGHSLELYYPLYLQCDPNCLFYSWKCEYKRDLSTECEKHARKRTIGIALMWAKLDGFSCSCQLLIYEPSRPSQCLLTTWHPFKACALFSIVMFSVFAPAFHLVFQQSHVITIKMS